MSIEVTYTEETSNTQRNSFNDLIKLCDENTDGDPEDNLIYGFYLFNNSSLITEPFNFLSLQLITGKRNIEEIIDEKYSLKNFREYISFREEYGYNLNLLNAICNHESFRKIKRNLNLEIEDFLYEKLRNEFFLDIRKCFQIIMILKNHSKLINATKKEIKKFIYNNLLIYKESKDKEKSSLPTGPVHLSKDGDIKPFNIVIDGPNTNRILEKCNEEKFKNLSNCEAIRILKEGNFQHLGLTNLLDVCFYNLSILITEYNHFLDLGEKLINMKEMDDFELREEYLKLLGEIEERYVEMKNNDTK